MSRPCRTFAAAPLALLLVLIVSSSAAAQACLGHPLEGRRAVLAARYAHLEAARDLGMEAAVRVHGPLAVTARLGHRTFDSGDGALRTVRADVSYTVRVLGLDVCPTAGMARETLDALDITLIPMAVGITAPVPLGPATLWPYLAPGIVRSRASVPGHERVTTDFDVRLGATLAAGRLLVGAGWERRYTDEVDGVAFVRLGFGF